MGSWSVACQISKIAITAGQECCIIPLIEDKYEQWRYVPTTLPIFGTYNDYGGLENVVECANTNLIEEYFGITIDEFVTYLVDGKHTYGRDEVKQIELKIETTKLEEIKDWRFMWVDKQVYDVMTQDLYEHAKGNHDFGNHELLNLLGFKLKPLTPDEELTNKNSKRFNKRYTNGDLELYSDGRWVQTHDGTSIYYADGQDWGKTNSMSTYITIPKELEYIKDIPTHKLWKIFSRSEQRQQLSYVFGKDVFNPLEELYYIINKPLDVVRNIARLYFDDLETYGDLIADLVSVKHNLYPMSSCFEPYKLYLTPQCGERKTHQLLLEKFAEINKLYMTDEEE